MDAAPITAQRQNTAATREAHVGLLRQERDQLLQRVADGDEGARDELIIHERRLVDAVARRVIGQDRRLLGHRDDLHAVATLALVEFVRRFDPRHSGAYFHTAVCLQARTWMRAYVSANIGAVSIPRTSAEHIADTVLARDILRERLGREPLAVEVAEESGRRPDTVLRHLRAHEALAAADDEGLDRLDHSSSEVQLLARERRHAQLRVAGRVLAMPGTARARPILLRYYGLDDPDAPRTPSTSRLAKVLKMSRTRIIEVKNDALAFAGRVLRVAMAA